MAIGTILCLGGSETIGDESNPSGYRSYRGALQLLLANAGYTVDFVGTLSSDPATGGDDPEHNGYVGARMDSSDDAGNSIEGRVSAIRTAVGAVDIIVLFIGWADAIAATASSATKYSDLLTTIRTGTWASAKIVMVNLHPALGKTTAQTGSDYPTYATINAQILAEADANHIVANLAALSSSSTADRDTMVEKLILDAVSRPEVTTRANGAGLPSVYGGHQVTSFQSIVDYNAQWRQTAWRIGGNGGTAGLASSPSVIGHPTFRDSVHAIVPWFWVFAGPGHNSVNTVVESRNLFAQAWRGSTGNWEFFFEGARTGADQQSDVYDGPNAQMLRGYRPDGITSYYRTSGGTNIECWALDTVPSRGIQGFIGGSNRTLMADAVCFCVGVQVRLALLDPSGPNDIAQSRFVVACGFDAYAGAATRYDYWGWPREMMDGGHDRWQILRSTDWSVVGSISIGRTTSTANGPNPNEHFEDPGTPPPHAQNWFPAMPFNDIGTYSKTPAQIRANPPRLPQYWSGGTTTSNGWAAADYHDTYNLTQQGADKAARVIYDAMVAADLLSGFTGTGPIDPFLLPGIAPVANWWPRFTTEATTPDTADWELGGPTPDVDPAWATLSPLPPATVGTAYSVQLQAYGSPPPTYEHVSGKPSWMSVSAAGAVTGTPTGAATSHSITFAAIFAGVGGVRLTRAERIAAKLLEWESRIDATYGALFAPNQGTIVYVDPSLGSGGAGTLGSPYGAMPTIVTGNTYLLKEGTEITGPLNITVANVLIGTYAIGSGARVYGRANRSRYATINMDGGRYGVQITSTGSVKLSGLRITQDGTPHSAATTLAVYASNASGSSSNIVEHCWLEDVVPDNSQITASGGIYFRGANNIARLNRIEGSPLDAIYLWANGTNGPGGSKAYGNYIHHGAYTVDGPDCVQVAPNSTPALGAIEVFDNFLRHDGNLKQAVMCNGGANGDSVLVKRNIIFGPTQSVSPPGGATKGKSILIEQAGSTIEGNYIEGGDWGIGVSGAQTGTTTVVGNVIVFDDGSSATYSVGIIPQMNGAVIRNNTIVVLSGTLNNGFEHTSASYTGLSCTDNIILADGGTITQGIRYRPAGVTEARNYVHGATTAFYNAATSSSTSAGTGSSTSDPQLAVDFGPETGAPVLSGGGSIGTAFIDPDGVSSGTAGPYIGAYQTISADGDSVEKVFALSVYVPPVITTTTVPNATEVVAYNTALVATGTGPLTWSLQSGTLPTGITLSTAGVLSGTPTGGAGASSITVRATGPSGAYDDQALTLTVVAAGSAPSITTTTLPTGTVGAAYSQTVTVTGTVTSSALIGALPAGLTYNTGTRVISGTPTAAESRSFSISATNSYGTDTQSLLIIINPEGASTTYGGWSRWIGR